MQRADDAAGFAFMAAPDFVLLPVSLVWGGPLLSCGSLHSL
jgi:hypothetical protein